MSEIFVNPYSKLVSDKFYGKFLERLRDEGKISNALFQKIQVVTELDIPTTFQQASNELFKMRAKLEHIIATCYNPPSTRLRRNYTDVADWYFICKSEGWI